MGANCPIHFKTTRTSGSLGAFSAGLKLNGSFPASNASFDSEVNSIGVELMPMQQAKIVNLILAWIRQQMGR